jgi:hypothetical protein
LPIALYGKVSMIFEHLHRIFHARDHPCLDIASEKWERVRDRNNGFGTHLHKQRKWVGKMFIALIAKQLPCRFLCYGLSCSIHSDIPFIFYTF